MEMRCQFRGRVHARLQKKKNVYIIYAFRIIPRYRFKKVFTSQSTDFFLVNSKVWFCIILILQYYKT